MTEADFNDEAARPQDISRFDSPALDITFPVDENDLGEFNDAVGEIFPYLEPQILGSDVSTEPSKDPIFMKVGYRTKAQRVGHRVVDIFVFAPPPGQYYSSILVTRRDTAGNVTSKDYYATSMSAEGHAKYDPNASRKLAAVKRTISAYTRQAARKSAPAN